MKIELEICKSKDVELLVTFIDEHWKKGHIFSRDRELLDWQHKFGEYYNFVLAKRDKEIVAILGFIPTSQYSANLSQYNQAWLAIWKVRDDVPSPGLGLMMLKYLKKEKQLALICSLGLSQQVIPLYRALKYKVGILNHYAFFNQDIDTFPVVQPPKSYKVNCSCAAITYRKVNEAVELERVSNIFNCEPKKDPEYICNRYLKHPRYKYEVVLFESGSRVVSMIVYRPIVVNELNVARIVDVQGESIFDPIFNSAISSLLANGQFHYIDIVTNLEGTGASGFKQNVKHDFTLPNYFEPFEMKNITIDYAYQCESNVNIFRGDSDQDRPNL